MLDIKLLREEPEKIKKGIKSKGVDPALVDVFHELDEQWRSVVKERDDAKARQNQLSKQWAQATDKEKEESQRLKEKAKELEARALELEKERELVWLRFPNLPSADTPVGKDESGNVVLRSWGKRSEFDFAPRDHIVLGEMLGLIDLERAAKVSGARFSYLMGDAVLLEFALVQLALNTLRDERTLTAIANKVKEGYSPKPFIPVVPPVLIHSKVFRKTGRLSPEDENERYYIPSDDLYLIGSAEHTLAPLHMDETLSESQLPLRYVGFSTSFRREAGSYGKDTRGILRVHQFDKIEMESFTKPEDSTTEQEFFVAVQEHLLQALELPYQVVAVCTGDMGGPDYRQIDIETWLPGQDRYRETHSADLITDYQSRRLRTRIGREGGDVFVHTNDATVFAIGRMLIAILENYQTKEGTIRIPRALQRYVGKEVIR